MIYSLICVVSIFFATHKFGGFHSVRGGAILLPAAATAVFVGCKLYCVEWERILIKMKKTSSVTLIIYESIILPLSITLIIIGEANVDIASSKFFFFGVIALFVILSDLPRFTHNFLMLSYRGPSELEAKKLFLRYPPNSRSDLLPMDVLLNFVLAFFLYKRFSF